MKIITSILLLLLIISCTESTPDCIDKMKDEFIAQNSERDFTFIYEFEQDGEPYYIFDSGVAFDAIAVVLNEDCETVCSYGGFRANNPDPCTDYQDGINRARQVWPE